MSEPSSDGPPSASAQHALATAPVHADAAKKKSPPARLERAPNGARSLLVPVTFMLANSVFGTGALLLLLGQNSASHGSIIERFRDQFIRPSMGIGVAGGIRPVEPQTPDGNDIPPPPALLPGVEQEGASAALAVPEASAVPEALAVPRSTTAAAATVAAVGKRPAQAPLHNPPHPPGGIRAPHQNELSKPVVPQSKK